MKGVELSVRARRVARWFGVDGDAGLGSSGDALNLPDVRLGGGRIILLSGPSGAGKSTLLRAIRRKRGKSVVWIDLRKIVLPRASVIDVMVEAMQFGNNAGAQRSKPRVTSDWPDVSQGRQVVEEPVNEACEERAILAALRALSRVGLGEVWSYLRRPGELSEGQRWRLRLGVALAQWGGGERGGKDEGGRMKDESLGRRLVVLGVDEFCAPLDRVTALVVARGLRKAVDLGGDFCAVVASSREDLGEALLADLEVRCDFGEYRLVGRVSNR
jgi:ABC-type ATPase with predicted acetyltransferase domain